ncbi:LysR family transcriptional regulator [Streptomyces sp900105755]|uniref:helix-turn-helix domain-containing protein n=1 Tax=Streptomyces sp. 900105755 TaxID=3154389 RepID=UPI003332B24E
MHLRYFVAVGEEQSFSAAARRLHMATSPLSQRIRDLGRELDHRLFDAAPTMSGSQRPETLSRRSRGTYWSRSTPFRGACAMRPGRDAAPCSSAFLPACTPGRGISSTRSPGASARGANCCAGPAPPRL